MSKSEASKAESVSEARKLVSEIGAAARRRHAKATEPKTHHLKAPSKRLTATGGLSYVLNGDEGASQNVQPVRDKSLSQAFSLAEIRDLELRKTNIADDERNGYGKYLFGDAEPATKTECRRRLNQFLRRVAGQEPSEDYEKEFLVRAIQHYARKFKLELIYCGGTSPTECRITTSSNSLSTQPKGFVVVEPGRSGKKLAVRNALPELAVR